jgi:hypothetical protein
MQTLSGERGSIPDGHAKVMSNIQRPRSTTVLSLNERGTGPHPEEQWRKERVLTFMMSMIKFYL